MDEGGVWALVAQILVGIRSKTTPPTGRVCEGWGGRLRLGAPQLAVPGAHDGGAVVSCISTFGRSRIVSCRGWAKEKRKRRERERGREKRG